MFGSSGATYQGFLGRKTLKNSLQLAVNVSVVLKRGSNVVPLHLEVIYNIELQRWSMPSKGFEDI